MVISLLKGVGLSSTTVLIATAERKIFQPHGLLQFEDDECFGCGFDKLQLLECTSCSVTDSIVSLPWCALFQILELWALGTGWCY